MRDDRWWRWAGLAGIALLAGVFAFLNSHERVALSFGLFQLYQVPLALLVFSAFLLGMVSMFLLGLRHDLRVRRLMEEHQLREGDRPLPERELPHREWDLSPGERDLPPDQAEPPPPFPP